MSSAVSQAIRHARSEGRAALVGYLPVGFPTVQKSIQAMVAMVEAGADVIEVGLPYTDPVLDGPVIQTAATQALEQGVRTKDVFAATSAVCGAGGTAEVMIYWNPVLRHGVDRFARSLHDSGASGLITPDLVPDEAGEWIEASDRYDLDRVFLVAPSSTSERLASTTAAGRGFVYAASLMGVTGARDAVGDQAQALVDRTKAVTDLPVCVGLGVSTPDQAAQIATFADGVIVGSALVRCLLDADTFEQGLDDLRSLTAALADGVRRGRPKQS